MADIRPAASLTSSLLARRGDARPAMRRQAVTHLHMPLSAHDDLGWNDIGDESEALPTGKPLTGLTPPDQAAYQAGFEEPEDYYEADEDQPHGGMSPLSPITRHLEAIAQRITDVARDTSSKPMTIRMSPQARPKRKPGTGLFSRRAAFTLRLDEERHLRLRLLSAVTRRSSQQLLIEALDLLLARHNQVEDLAGRVEEADEAPSAVAGR